MYVSVSVCLCVMGFILLQKDRHLIYNLVNSSLPKKQYQTLILPQTAGHEEIATVSAVIDGDTIVLTDKKKVRYIGVDTPELHHPKKKIECFGVEARDKNRSIVEGKTIRMKKDVSDMDKYGRLLRYVWVDSLFVNEFLVREGYALPATFPPDIMYSRLFQIRSQEAREEHKGLWNMCY